MIAFRLFALPALMAFSLLGAACTGAACDPSEGCPGALICQATNDCRDEGDDDDDSGASGPGTIPGCDSDFQCLTEQQASGYWE